MARINVEEDWFKDPRRDLLREFLGHVRGTEEAAVNFWRLSQLYWQRGELIPGHIFIHTYGAKALLQSSLARVYETKKIWVYPDPCDSLPNMPQRSPNDVEREMNECRTKWASVRELEDLHSYFIYACGSREHHFWLVKGYLQRVEAGKKSAAKRKLLNGSAQPSNGLERKGIPFDGFLERARTAPNGPEPSTSFSSSFSNNLKTEKKKNTYTGCSENSPSAFDLESLFKIYPKRDVNVKKAEGLKRLNKKIKTQEQFDEFKRAIENYAEYIKAKGWEDTQYVCQFSTFCGNGWQEYINPVIAVSNGKSVTSQNNSAVQRLLERKREELNQQFQLIEGGEGNESESK